MQKRMRALTLTLCLVTMLIVSPGLVTSRVREPDLKYCVDLTFSTEEDFVGQDIIISDGDLLGIVHDATGPQCGICARNADLLANLEVRDDIGLDAADVISADAFLVAFSTELDSPNNALPTIHFTAGDLLDTNGARIPNMALTVLFQVPYDIGLDAVHFVGETDAIIEFLTDAEQYGRDDWLDPDPGLLVRKLEEFDIDILFSTEGTWSVEGAPGFLDGDLLSVRRGAIVIPNADLLDPSVPAGIPADGVDFGLDAVTADRRGTEETIHYSTEILYDGRLSFTDGDVLKNGNGVLFKNYDLLHCFEPKARELGLDALSVGPAPEPGCVSRLTKIGGVDVADISLADGMVFSGTVGIMAPVPFGGRIDFQGTICDDVDEFRVAFREAGSGGGWTGMDVQSPKGWKIKTDAFLPPYPDCLDQVGWASDAAGWYNASDYRHLSEAALGGCNPGLSLTVWETAGIDDGLYEVVLETKTGGGTLSDMVHLVKVDNTPPKVELEKTWGECKVNTDADMPLTITGRMTDTHFYMYELMLTGDSFGWESYGLVAFYDDPLDNVIETGTVSYGTYVDLDEVNVWDLVTSPEELVPCGYTVTLTGWDRTLACHFTYGANHISRCLGCRHVMDAWTFDYEPGVP